MTWAAGSAARFSGTGCGSLAAAGAWETSTTYPNNWFNATAGTLFYTPDLSRPAYDVSWYRELRGRVTWQATSKDKISVTGRQ